MASVILCFTFLNLLVFVQCAPDSPAGDSYGIIATEWAIRDTLNNLFSTLKLKVIQQKLKLKQYSTIHNFFVSITLKDHDNLKKIAKLTQVENIDNGTRVFIAQLNEVFDEDNKSDVATDSVYVKILIEEFIDRLDNLKETNKLRNNTKFDLNKAILRYFSKHENEFENNTYFKKDHNKGNDSDNNVLDSIESWLPSGRRIFEGTKSSIKRFPFMASVQFFKKFQCGGSIIKSDLIITSGSCLQIAYNNRFFRENPAFLSVQVGSNLYEHGGENVPVLEVNFHPNYNPKNLRHNLAIMRLTRTLKFTRRGRKIKKINFDRNPWTLPANTDGIVIVGWGARALGTDTINLWKNELSYSTLDFYPLAECQEIYTKEFVTDHNFCAGFISKGGGACNHDAGGPGVSTGILVGVISFGAPLCGTPDAPTVFTKLGFYTDWIEEIMATKTLHGSQPTTHRTVSYQKYGLPAFTRTTSFRVTPIVATKRPKDNQDDRLRTDDKKNEFKDFLKTMFKKKKQGQEKEDDVQEEEEEESARETEDISNISKLEEELGLEDLLEQEVGLEIENVEKREDERKQENVQEQENLENQEDVLEQEDLEDQEHVGELEDLQDQERVGELEDLEDQEDVREQEIKKEDVGEQEIKKENVQRQVSEQEHTQEETEEVSKSETIDRAQYQKEVDKSKPKHSLRNKSKKKPLINKPKSAQLTMESESKSNEDSVATTSRPKKINKAKVTLLDDYDASTPTTPSFKKRSDRNENTSSEQETDIDDAIESLIGDLDLNLILESKNSSSKDQQQMTAREVLRNDTVLNKSDFNTNTKGKKPRRVVENKNINVKKYQSDADEKSDKESSNGKSETDEDLDENQASNLDDDTDEQNVNDNKNVTKAINGQSAENVEDYSNDNDGTELSEEGINKATKDDKKKNDNDNDEIDDGDDTEEDVEGFSISAKELDQKNSEKLLEMLDYEDLYKLLMKDSERLT